jgi:hypothetical protein
MKDDHIVCDFGAPRPDIVLTSIEQLPMRCLHCGDRYVLPLPCSVTMAAVVSKQYVREHRRCKPRPVADSPAPPTG